MTSRIRLVAVLGLVLLPCALSIAAEENGADSEPARTPITEVLTHSEDNDDFKYIAKNAKLTDALEAFDASARRGNILDALLITHSGKNGEKLLGIITHFDLPKIYAKLEV